MTPLAMCIAIVAGSTTHVLPTGVMTLAWIHTVEKTPWEEDYIVAGGALVIREARVKASGAGMDVPPDAIWAGGWWRYTPALEPLHEVTLANSSFAPGYTICWKGTCQPLKSVIPVGDFVRIAPAPCGDASLSKTNQRRPQTITPSLDTRPISRGGF